MNESQAKKLGALVEKSRVSQGLSLRDAEAKSNCAAAWIMRLEKGVYDQPAIDKLTALVEALGIDSAKVDRLTGGYLSDSLPSSRVYFRSRYGLSQEETEEIEKQIAKLKAPSKMSPQRGKKN
jgi:transcriptional regulator with XRE-family HTH domain